jgi:L-lysine 2,3-aminomutase
VLLKGINDSVEALGDLFRTMIRTGIVPYYLHQLDRVKGASHFEVDQQRGKQLMAALQTRCAGYALPRYVREVASEKSKVLLFP